MCSSGGEGSQISSFIAPDESSCKAQPKPTTPPPGNKSGARPVPANPGDP